MNKKHLFLYLLITTQLFFLNGCYFLDETHSSFTQLPKVGTTEIVSIDSASVVVSSKIMNNGGATIKSRGICWSTSPNPTVNGYKLVDPMGADSLICTLTILKKNTTYYVRAFATNKAGTAYGNTLIFTTNPTDIILSTNPIINIDLTTATGGGVIASTNASSILEKGICWSTVPNPTVTDNKTSEGIGIGNFNSAITGLAMNTTYYVRAFAVNSTETVYGNEVSFKTKEGVVDIDGNVYRTVTIGTQTWMVENLITTKYNDGTAIPNVTDGTAWMGLTTGAWCDYDNLTANDKYGKLYNWYAVHTAKLAPIGWHVPTDAEWTTLYNYVNANLGNSGSVGKALAATTGWNTDTSVGAIGNDLSKNNSTGFSAMQGGYRYTDGSFDSFFNGDWWSSTASTISGKAFNRYMYYNLPDLYSYSNFYVVGLYVRCIKD